MNHYEIHVTVRTNNIPEFQKACYEIGVKAIVIDLQTSTGETVFHDVMTSHKLSGKPEDWKLSLGIVQYKLERMGFKVVRRKVEESPDNKDAAKPIYYESHIRVLCNSDRINELRDLARGKKGLHVSRNVFKEGYIMLTYRDTCDLATFKANVYTYVEMLNKANFKHDKLEIESAIYDSNINHDEAWIHDRGGSTGVLQNDTVQ